MSLLLLLRNDHGPVELGTSSLVVRSLRVAALSPAALSIQGATIMGGVWPSYPVNFVVDQSFAIRALITSLPVSGDPLGSPLGQSDLEWIRIWVYSGNDVVAGFGPFEPAIEDVIHDQLIEADDPRIAGWNLSLVLPPAAFPVADTLARVVIKYQTSDGDSGGFCLSGPVREL